MGDPPQADYLGTSGRLTLQYSTTNSRSVSDRIQGAAARCIVRKAAEHSGGFHYIGTELGLMSAKKTRKYKGAPGTRQEQRWSYLRSRKSNSEHREALLQYLRAGLIRSIKSVNLHTQAQGLSMSYRSCWRW